MSRLKFSKVALAAILMVAGALVLRPASVTAQKTATFDADWYAVARSSDSKHYGATVRSTKAEARRRAISLCMRSGDAGCQRHVLVKRRACLWVAEPSAHQHARGNRYALAITSGCRTNISELIALCRQKNRGAPCSVRLRWCHKSACGSPSKRKKPSYSAPKTKRNRCQSGLKWHSGCQRCLVPPLWRYRC